LGILPPLKINPLKPAAQAGTAYTSRAFGARSLTRVGFLAEFSNLRKDEFAETAPATGFETGAKLSSQHNLKRRVFGASAS